jgi:hypothetical protein
VPTILYYDQHQKVVGWGADIGYALAPSGYPKPGIQKVEWFKLQLMRVGTYTDHVNLPPLPPGKTEIEVAADYLLKLRQAMRAQLQKILGGIFDREERFIEYYFTIPPIWNESGKAGLRAAVKMAQFSRAEIDDRITFITEPEATAVYCAKYGLLNVQMRDVILIVDCGSGTVDLMAYEVTSTTPFSLIDCTAPSGDSCGSV